jgi:putative membrane protein
VIRYPSRSWSAVLANVFRSSVLRTVVVGAVGVGLYAEAVLRLTDAGVIPAVPLKPTLFPLVTVLLSLLLAFRTNTAYDRWWEGRKLWGALVNNTRNLAIFLDSTLPVDDADHRRRFAAQISGYAAAVKGHLRDGVDFEDLRDLDAATLQRLRTLEHVPNAIASLISRRIYDLAKDGIITGFELVNLKAQVAELTDIVGGCERIKNTPIPYSYAGYERHLLTWFVLALPFGLRADYGALTAPLTAVAFMALAGLEMLAADIEDPFGSDESDLPTAKLSAMIRRNVHELLIGSLPADDAAPPTETSGVHVER